MTKSTSIHLINHEFPTLIARSTVQDSGNPKEIRVTFREGTLAYREQCAYYTTDPQDAYDTAKHMASRVICEGTLDREKKHKLTQVVYTYLSPAMKETVKTLLDVSRNQWANYLSARKLQGCQDLAHNDKIRAKASLHCARMARIHCAQISYK